MDGPADQADSAAQRHEQVRELEVGCVLEHKVFAAVVDSRGETGVQLKKGRGTPLAFPGEDPDPLVEPVRLVEQLRIFFHHQRDGDREHDHEQRRVDRDRPD